MPKPDARPLESDLDGPLRAAERPRHLFRVTVLGHRHADKVRVVPMQLSQGDPHRVDAFFRAGRRTGGGRGRGSRDTTGPRTAPHIAPHIARGAEAEPSSGLRVPSHARPRLRSRGRTPPESGPTTRDAARQVTKPRVPRRPVRDIAATVPHRRQCGDHGVVSRERIVDRGPGKIDEDGIAPGVRDVESPRLRPSVSAAGSPRGQSNPPHRLSPTGTASEPISDPHRPRHACTPPTSTSRSRRTRPPYRTATERRNPAKRSGCSRYTACAAPGMTATANPNRSRSRSAAR